MSVGFTFTELIMLHFWFVDYVLTKINLYWHALRVTIFTLDYSPPTPTTTISNHIWLVCAVFSVPNHSLGAI